MATTKSQQTHPAAPAPANAPQPPAPGAAKTAGADGEKALVLSSPAPAEEKQVKLPSSFARLPVELDVSVPVKDFRVRNLLALEPGQVIETRWANGVDMPLASGEVQLAWSEFEVVDSQLAVRVTRLA
jgi:flagellar motor switch protein FliN/FliY